MNNENEAPAEEPFQYWEEDGWRPCNKSGTQRSPNQIRAELQKYIDNSSQTQTAITESMGINNNSFRKFMNPKTYKNQWSATSNGTYWAASKLLEQERNRLKVKVNGKRKGDADNDNTASNKKSKTEIKLEMMTLMNQVAAVQGVNEHVVLDTCIQLVKKVGDSHNILISFHYPTSSHPFSLLKYPSSIGTLQVKAFLAQDGVTKVDFCFILGGVNSNSLNRFLAGKAQDQAENITYRRAYAFFEKKRILEGGAKSKARIKNEMEHASGFALERPRLQRWFF